MINICFCFGSGCVEVGGVPPGDDKVVVFLLKESRDADILVTERKSRDIREHSFIQISDRSHLNIVSIPIIPSFINNCSFFHQFILVNHR